MEFSNGAVNFSPNGLNLAGGGSSQSAYDGTQGPVQLVGVDGGVDVEFNNDDVYFSPNGLNLAGGGSTQLAYDGTQGRVPARRR